MNKFGVFNKALYLKSRISIFDTKQYNYLMNWKTFDCLCGMPEVLCHPEFGALLFDIPIEIDERFRDGEIILGVIDRSEERE